MTEDEGLTAARHGRSPIAFGDVVKCRTCLHFAPLSPGHAAICYAKWKGLPWNAGIPLTTKDEWCELHEPRGLSAVEGASPEDVNT